VEQFGEEVAAALDGRLVSLLLYGSAARGGPGAGRASINTLLICDGVDARLFAALAPLVAAWTRGGHPPPIVLSETEWGASADAFAIEYEDIRAAHRVVAGRDPWSGSRCVAKTSSASSSMSWWGSWSGCAKATSAGWTTGTAHAARGGQCLGLLHDAPHYVAARGDPGPGDPGGLVLAAAAVVGFPAADLADVVAHVEGVHRSRSRPATRGRGPISRRSPGPPTT
jgi:hypothetical protein